MSLTRRGFLGLLTTAAAGVAIAPELADLLAPRKTIFLPPKGGWFGGIGRYDVTVNTGPLLTCEMIHREAMRILEMDLTNAMRMRHVYDDSFAHTVRTATINIRRPPRYSLDTLDRLVRKL